MTLKIFTDSRTQDAFLERLSAQLEKRVAEAPSETGGAAAAAARAVEDRDVSNVTGFYLYVAPAQSLIQNLAMDPSKALAFMIGQLLGESHDDSLAVYFAHTVLSGLEVFTDAEKQALLDEVKTNHSTYHATPIEQPIRFNKPEELEALITAYYKGRLPIMLTALLAENEENAALDIPVEIPDTIAYQIAAQGIPHDFIINYEFSRCTTTDEKLAIATTLEAKYGRHILTKQYAALEYMEQNAHAIGITREQGVEYFQKQYGDTPETQLARMLEEFKETPHQVEHSGRKLRFVNQDFIHVWDRFETSSDIQNLLIDEPRITRLPRSLLDVKTTPTNLVIGNRYFTGTPMLSDVPGWLGELSNLKYVTFLNWSAYNLKYKFDFTTAPGVEVYFLKPNQGDGSVVQMELRVQLGQWRGSQGIDMDADRMQFNIQEVLTVFQTMKANSCGPGITAERADQAFVEEFGDTPTQQLINFIRTFERMPDPDALREAFNQSYFDFKKEIEAQDGSTEIKANTTELRFIPGALKKHAATLTHLDVSGNQMRLTPLNLHKTFPKLETMNFTCEPYDPEFMA